MNMQQQGSQNSRRSGFDSVRPACGVVALVITVLLVPLAFAVLEWQTSGSVSASLLDNLGYAVVVALCFAPVNVATVLMRARNLWRAKSGSSVPSISAPMISFLLTGAGGLVIVMSYNATSRASEDWTDVAIGMAAVVFGVVNALLWIVGDVALRRIIQRGTA
jgi:hypothetical protein